MKGKHEESLTEQILSSGVGSNGSLDLTATAVFFSASFVGFRFQYRCRARDSSRTQNAVA